jgi:hypothetical protein
MRSLVGLVLAVGALAVAAPASAADLLSQTVSAASAVDKSCTASERSGAGVAQKSFNGHLDAGAVERHLRVAREPVHVSAGGQGRDRP